MKRELKRGVYIELLCLAFLIGLNVWLLFSMGSLSELKPDPKPGALVLIAGIGGMMLAVLGVHELGHLIVGLAQGLELTIFVVGPLGIRKEDGKTKVYLNTNLMLAGGIAGTAPVDDSPANEDRFRRVVIAGPMMSLVFSAICLSLAWRVPNSATFPTGFFLGAGGILSIVIFFATTIPSKTGVFFTDRKRYQRLMFPGKAKNVELATLRIMGSYQQHDSYRHVAVSDIEELISADEPINRFLGYFNMVCYQAEADNQVDPQVEANYVEAGKDVNQTLVKAYDDELAKHKAKFLKQ
ncbi:MAG: M50 family metallopeptidase [Planctomycetaceae bacterium]